MKRHPSLVRSASRPPMSLARRHLAVCAILAAIALPGGTTRAQAPSPAPNPGSIQFETKVVSLTRSAVRHFQEQERGLDGAAPLLADKLARIFAGDWTAAGGGAANFSVTETITSQEMNDLLRRLNGTEGFELVSLPRVSSHSGQQATVEIIREFLYVAAFERAAGPDGKPVLTPTKFKKKNVGLTLTLEGVLTPARDAVDLNVSWQQVSMEGLLRTKDGQAIPAGVPESADTRPVFDTQALDTCVTVPPDATLLLGSLRRHPGTWNADLTQGSTPPREESIVLAFVSLELVDPSMAASGPSPVRPEPPPADRAVLPYGIPVAGKPGYVQSPYAPDSGYVDLRGFTRGQEVRDPYTGKLFLVP